MRKSKFSGTDRRGDALSAVGLEAVRPAAGRRPAVEPQARAPGVLRVTAESAATHDPASTAADPSAADAAVRADNRSLV